MLRLEGKRVLLTGASGFIGTNFVDLLTTCGAEVVNADIRPPLWPAHNAMWRRCDVGSPAELAALTGEFDPHLVVHLAARTDTQSPVVAEYAINHTGTRNMTRALEEAPSVERFVFVSSQFVVGPNAPFESETTYAPHTAYGESKAEAEIELRAHPPRAVWTIVRPTNVWGPWHLRYQRQFWRVLRRGMYLHPTSPDPIRSYAYVGSVCLQVLAVLLADQTAVHERALYVGDMPIPLSHWVDAFSIALRGKRARRVPGAAMAKLAKLGDVAQAAGLPTPLNSSRYSSMTSDYPTPMDRTAASLGWLPVVPLSQGVAETAAWLEDGLPPHVTVWMSNFSVSAMTGTSDHQDSMAGRNYYPAR